MLAAIMLIVGLLMLIAALYGIFRTAFQISPFWGVSSVFGLPLILFLMKYFLRVKYCLMILILGVLSIGISLFGGADQSLRLRIAADQLGISQYPLINLLRYPRDKVVADKYINIEDNNEVWLPSITKDTVNDRKTKFFPIKQQDIINHIDSEIIATTFSGETVSGYVEKLEGNKVTLRRDKVNSRTSFTYNTEFFETIKVTLP